jgi:hypothetical protein
MARFTDTAGRVWVVEINIAAAKRVRSRLGLDLLARNLGELLQRMFEDPILLVDVLFVLVEPEARDRGISDEEFGRAMAADALEGGAQAVLEAIRDFTPNPTNRAIVGKLMAEIQHAVSDQNERAVARAEQVIQEIRRAATSGELFRSLPESPESHQNP